MKRVMLSFAIVLVMAAITLGQDNGSQAAQPKPLPKETAEKIGQVDERMKQLQQDLQTLQLLRDNLLLTAALELGINKKELDGLQLGKDSSGRLVFIPVPPKQKDDVKAAAVPGAAPPKAQPR